MNRPLRAVLLVFAVLLARQAAAQSAGSEYVVPQTLFGAIAEEYSGEKALDNIRGITRFHRVQASPGFSQAREWVVEQLRAAGITDVDVEKFLSDGQTRYSTHVSPMAWTIREGELWVEEPFHERLCRFSDQPVCLSTLSNGGEWRGEAINVGRGTEASDYVGSDVRGKIVFASGYAGAVHREAVIRRGALGVVIYPRPDDRPEHPDLVRYNGLWVQGEEKEKATFGFQISLRQWERLRPALASGKLVLRARVEAELRPGNLEVTSAYLRGSDPSQELILVAHLDHYKFGANDNASGSAAILEIARTLKALLDQKRILPLRRTLHFLWVPEHFGTVAWLTRHPEVSQRVVAALNLDMVGENLYKTDSTLRITRTPESLPSFVNDLVENVAEQVEAANLVSPNGSRNLFHWRMTPYDPGSDHDMFNDSSVRVPSLMFGHWPDWTHHTNEDSVDKADSTTLRRVGVLAAVAAVWLATAGDDEAMRLVPFVKASAEYARLRRGGSFAVLRPMDPAKAQSAERQPSPEMHRELAQAKYRDFLLSEPEWSALQSLGVLMSEKGRAALEPMLPGPAFTSIPRPGLAEKEQTPQMNRVPRKKFIGPIADGPSSLWFREGLGAEYFWWQERAAKVPKFELITYEAANFADGKRTLAEIEERVALEYGALPAGLVEGIFERLARVGLVEWAASK